MLQKKPRIFKVDGNGDEDFYWKRLVRNDCFLGADKEQQHESQQKLANTTIGVAGCGGLGSYLAVQLARVGVGHIKVADPDHFEASCVDASVYARNF